MSAMTVSVPQVHSPVDQTLAPVTTARPCTIMEAPTASAEWRLTDRGIAVIMACAVMILTAALVVIGLTAVRVTSTDYRADFALSQVDQR
ncbi:MAG TPA: hypothetical protein VHR39_07340 [Propionibacteriaceae bacterium]|nr:hypothetical protein [Propionibacteriaceae bacterium]